MRGRIFFGIIAFLFLYATCSGQSAITEAGRTDLYDSVRTYSGGLAAVKTKTGWGFIDVYGKIKIECRYDAVSDFSENVSSVRTAGNWQLINTNGEVIKTYTKLNQPKRIFIAPTPQVIPTLNETENLRLANITGTTPCPPNIDFEYGNFTNWRCYTGTTSVSANTNITTTNNFSGPLSGRHTIVPRVTPSLIDYYGHFPTNPPDGSGYAVKIGNDFTGAQAERVRYTIRVPNNDPNYSITFQYAVVLENPELITTGVEHDDWEQPRFTAKMFDSATGQYIDCASFTYVASLVPGFQVSSITTGGLHSSPADAAIRYKPWSSVYVNLSKYPGKTLYLDFTTADCTLGGHFGYAYVDVVECGIAAKVKYNCTAPNITNLTGPPGFETYKWFNSNFSTQLGTTKDLTLNPGPAIGTSFWVVVKPYNNTDCPTCDCRDTIGVTIDPQFPLAEAGPPLNVCVGGSGGLGSTPVTGMSYQWSPATGLNNTAIANPLVTPLTPRQYYLTVTDNATGCSSIDSTLVNVQPIPVVDFTPGNSAQCLNDNNFSFSNASTISSGTLSYDWKFGDGSNSTQTNPNHSYVLSGPYSVKLIAVSAFGCKDSSSKNITVYPKPLTGFNINNPGQCITGNNFQFTNISNIATGSFTSYWDFGDGSFSTNTNAAHSYASAGTYQVKLVLTSGNGCKDSLTKPVVVDPIPVAAFTINDPAQCLNTNNFSFSNSSSIVSGSINYVWTFGDGGTSTQRNPAHSYTTGINYLVKLVVTSSFGCKDSIDHPLTLYPKPNPLWTSNNDQQCFIGNSFTFTNSSTISSGFQNSFWSFGDGSTSQNLNSNHAYNAPGSYLVKLLMVSDQGCRDSLIKPVVVNPNPIVSVTTNKNLILCRGSGVQLGVTGAQTYTWSPAQDLSCTNCPAPIASPLTGNVKYSVIGYNSFGCPAEDSLRINVIQPFGIQTSNTSICLTQSANLLATGAVTYLWSPAADLDKNNIPNPVAKPSSTTTYTVVGYDSYNCFTDTAYATVTVHPLPVINLGPDLQLATGTVQPMTYTLQGGPIATWSWSPATLLSCTTCPVPIVTIKNDVAYTVDVTNIYGCKGHDNIMIKTFCANSQLFIPNAFTPDGDGINDILTIQAKGIAKIKSFRIFNRWGELLFEKLNFVPNDPAYSWDGKIRGQVGPPDVFVYTAEVVCENGIAIMYKGNVSILK